MQLLLSTGAARHQVHLQRTVRDLTNRQPCQLAERVPHLLQRRHVYFLADLHSLKYVKVLNWNLKFFREELRQVRHDRRAAVKEQPHRFAAALLFLPELNRLVYLHMHAGHHLTGNFGKGRLVWVIRFGIRAAQTNKTLLQLNLLRLRKTHLGFRGKLLRDGVGADVDRAEEKFLTVKKEDVGGLCADVQHHGAALEFAVVVAEGIDERRLGGVDQLHVHSSRLDQIDDAVRHLALQRGNEHLNLAGLGDAHCVVIPGSLLQREGNVLRGLKLDQLRHLGVVYLRDAHRLGKNLKTGSRQQRGLGLKTGLVEQLSDRFLQRLRAGPLTRSLKTKWLDPETHQSNPGRGWLELGRTQGAGPHIHCQKRFGTHFNSLGWTKNRRAAFNSLADEIPLFNQKRPRLLKEFANGVKH